MSVAQARTVASSSQRRVTVAGYVDAARCRTASWAIRAVAQSSLNRVKTYARPDRTRVPPAHSGAGESPWIRIDLSVAEAEAQNSHLGAQNW